MARAVAARGLGPDPGKGVQVISSLPSVPWLHLDPSGALHVCAATARGRVVRNTLPVPATLDDVNRAITMVNRRRAAWDRLQGVIS